jgi:hypothetical protein
MLCGVSTSVTRYTPFVLVYMQLLVGPLSDILQWRCYLFKTDASINGASTNWLLTTDGRTISSPSARKSTHCTHLVTNIDQVYNGYCEYSNSLGAGIEQEQLIKGFSAIQNYTATKTNKAVNQFRAFMYIPTVSNKSGIHSPYL